MNTYVMLVLSPLAYTEKLTKLQWLGVVSGIASVIFLCDPFG